MANSLAELLFDRIRRNGPITFHDWMQSALYDAQHGYYCRADLARWGREGDYRTSSHVSILFAATFARYFAQLFVELGKPRLFTIVEQGGGTGQFAAQILGSLEKRYPHVFERVNYVLDEISEDARNRAREELARFHKHIQFKRLAELYVDQGIVFSNELIDAFPVHRIGLREGNFFEFHVGAGGNDEFEWVDGPISSPRLLEYLKRFRIQPVEGQILEVNLAMEDWYRQLAQRTKRVYLITVDYGSEAEELYRSPMRMMGTLRAFKRHQIGDSVLRSPGEQDITSTIDWTAMKEIGVQLGFEIVEFEQQDRFLLKQGVLDELELLVAEAEGEAAKMRLRTSAREMILPGGLAGNFQVLVQRKGI